MATPAEWGVVFTYLMYASAAYNLLMTVTADDDISGADQESGTLVNTRSVSEVLPLVYGKGRVGGNQVYMTTTGTDNTYLHMILTLSEGETNQLATISGTSYGEVDQIYLNGELYVTSEYKDDFTYEFFSGSSTQNVCSTLETATIYSTDSWVDPLRYTSYLYCKFKYDRDKPLSVPTVTAVIEGLKVKNFATENDYDSMPMAYSNNIAYCVYDLLTRSSVRGGKGIDPTRIDLASFRDAATYYDTYGWTCNITVNKDQSVEDNLDTLLVNGRSCIVYSNCKFKLKFRDTREESVCMQITEDDIIQDGKESSLEISPAASLFSRPNSVKATFYSEDKNYVEDEKVFTDDTAFDTEGDARELSISLLGLSTLETVIPMSYYYLERSRWGNSVKMTVGNKGMALEPMDLVEITSTMPGWTDTVKPLYRVETVSLQENGNVALSLLQEHDDLYNDDYDVDTQELFVTDLPKPGDEVHGVINISHSEEVYYYRDRSFTRWKILFDPPLVSDYPFWDYAEIWLKIGTGGEYVFMTTSRSDYTVDPVEEGERYYVKMRSVSTFGVKEDFDGASTVSKLIVGKTDIPSDMTSITAVASGDIVSIYGDEVSDPDIAGYEIRMADAWTGGIFVAFNESPNFRIAGVKPGTFTFWCKPKDNSGNYSTNAVSDTVTVFYPSNYVDISSWSHDFNETGTHDNTNPVVYDLIDSLQCSHISISGTILNENCRDLAGWTNGDTGNAISTVYPIGQYSFNSGSTAAAGTYAYRYKDIGNMPNTITYEIRLKHTALGTLADQDCWVGQIMNASTNFVYVCASNGFYLYNNGWTEIGTNLVKYGGSVEWQTWRFLINYTTLKVDVYLADSTHNWEFVLERSFTDYGSPTNGMVKILQYGCTTTVRITQIEHVRIDDGLTVPEVVLTGTWTSPEYDFTSSKTVRIWGDFDTVFVDSGMTWEGIFPSGPATTWDDITDSTTTWNDITTPDSASSIAAKIKWGTSTGVYPNEAERFELLAPEFVARYVQVEVIITDPNMDAYLYLKELQMKTAYW